MSKDKIYEIIKKETQKLDWNLSENKNVNLLSFKICSPKGQDFSFEIEMFDDIDDTLQQMYEYYINFDVSTEAYYWLDNFGHGIKGAPYDMKELYEDMEWCREEIYTLYRSIIARRWK